jgi:predicted ATPase
VANASNRSAAELLDEFVFSEGKTARICDVGATNFRAFREVGLHPGDVTAIVGPNAAGKSSFVDIFRFISDSLNLSLYTALERRGGVQAVRHSSPTRPRNFKIWVKLQFESDIQGFYMFRVRSEAAGSYSVPEEECTLSHRGTVAARLALKDGKVTDRRSPFYDRIKVYGDGIAPMPSVERSALGLPVLGVVPELSPILNILRDLRTYSIVPDKLREWQEPDEGHQLAADGSNAASVLRNLGGRERRELMEMMNFVVPGITAVEAIHHGNRLTLRFKQEAAGGKRNQFEALQMSDGTLRLLGILLALFQPSSPEFLAIEEPEATIHVAALQALMEILKSRAHHTQIILTTHSADILDAIDIDSINLVTASEGHSRLAPVSQESRRAVYEALFTPGELLRSGALEPEPA